MPEGVEVCLTAQFLHNQLKNHSITNIFILGGRYSRHPLSGLSDFKKQLPLTIQSINSKGKFLWFQLHNNHNNIHYIMNTFGLEGFWSVIKHKHSNVMFTLNHPTKNKTFALYFNDSRNFGTIIFDSKQHSLNRKLQSLGPDLLKTSFTDNDFFLRIKNYILNKHGSIISSRADRKIVKVLMDQTANTGLGSGIGNYLVQEILYRSKISPHTNILSFFNNPSLAHSLSHHIKYTIKLSYLTSTLGYFNKLDNKHIRWIKRLRKTIKNNPHHRFNFHPDISLHSDTFKFLVYRRKKDPLDNTVTADKILPGRTTYWVPNVQQ